MSKRNTTVEQEVIDWYQKGEPIKDIVEANGLTNDQALYNILRKHNIPLRRNRPQPQSEAQKRIEPVKPTREWFSMDECAAIVSMSIEDIEWLIRKGAVHAETIADGKLTLIYLPSLMEAGEHATIDGKRARQLLHEAWEMLDKVAAQRAINIDDAKWICKAISEFFTANGWKL